MATVNISITGRVSSIQTKVGIPGLKVEAWDTDSIIDDMVGSSVTADDGKLSIVCTRKYFEELLLDREPDVYFRIFSGMTLVASTKDNVMWNIESEQNSSEILVDLEPENKKTRFTV